MALEKRTFIEDINIKPDGRMFIRAVRVIYDDGEEEGKKTRALLLTPGMDVDTAFVSMADDNQVGRGFKVPFAEIKRVKDVSKVVWTQAVIDAFNAAKVPVPSGS